MSSANLNFCLNCNVGLKHLFHLVFVYYPALLSVKNKKGKGQC